MPADTTTLTLDLLRQFGEARIEVAERCKTSEDWQRLWPAPKFPFTMSWGDCWTFAPCYRVADYAAEVGFWLDALGFDSNAFSAEFCMVMDPGKQLTFSIRPTSDTEKATDPRSFTLEFMVQQIKEVAAELQNRGIALTQPPTPYGSENSRMHTVELTTPAGIRVILWGLVPSAES